MSIVNGRSANEPLILNVSQSTAIVYLTDNLIPKNKTILFSSTENRYSPPPPSAHTHAAHRADRFHLLDSLLLVNYVSMLSNNFGLRMRIRSIAFKCLSGLENGIKMNDISQSLLLVKVIYPKLYHGLLCFPLKSPVH